MSHHTKLQSTEIALSELSSQFFEIAQINPLDRVRIISRILAKFASESVIIPSDAVTLPVKRKAGRPPGSKNRPRFILPLRNRGVI